MADDRFDAHYREIFGDRWEDLRAALTDTRTQIARLSRFHPQPHAHLPADAREVVPGCFASAELEPPAGPPPLPYYVMDAASVIAARALDVSSGNRVLDLCAAPGGKSLILAEAIASAGTLTCNDSSRGRVSRLRAVLRSYLPGDLLERVRITGFDGARWGLHEPGRYDRVLVDAPCSSEAHVLADPKALALWSPARPKQLAVRQGALLAAAIDSAAPGGRVVYSTCALDPRENDGVVRKILKKRQGRAELDALPRGESVSLGEATECGTILLPDRTGFGPIYFAVLRRL